MEGSLTTGGKNWMACLELFCSGKRNRPTGTYKFRKYSLHGPQEKQSRNFLKRHGLSTPVPDRPVSRREKVDLCVQLAKRSKPHPAVPSDRR